MSKPTPTQTLLNSSVSLWPSDWKKPATNGPYWTINPLLSPGSVPAASLTQWWTGVKISALGSNSPRWWTGVSHWRRSTVGIRAGGCSCGTMRTSPGTSSSSVRVSATATCRVSLKMTGGSQWKLCGRVMRSRMGVRTRRAQGIRHKKGLGRIRHCPIIRMWSKGLWAKNRNYSIYFQLNQQINNWHLWK